MRRRHTFDKAMAHGYPVACRRLSKPARLLLRHIESECRARHFFTLPSLCGRASGGWIRCDGFEYETVREIYDMDVHYKSKSRDISMCIAGALSYGDDDEPYYIKLTYDAINHMTIRNCWR